MHEEPAQDGVLGQTFIPAVDHKLPKRISALLDCEIKVVSIFAPDFASASRLVDATKMPISLAVDVCAVIRECSLSKPLRLALPKPVAWTSDLFKSHWCSDLPWQAKKTVSLTGAFLPEDSAYSRIPIFRDESTSRKDRFPIHLLGSL